MLNPILKMIIFDVFLGATMKKILSLSLVMLALAGCATAPQIQIQEYSARAETVTIPAINVESEAELGQNIVSKAYRSVYPAISLDHDVMDPDAAAWGSLKIYAGVLRLYAENESGKFYLAEKAQDVKGGEAVKDVGGVFVPSDTSKPAVVFGTNYPYSKILMGTIPVAGLKSTTYESWNKDSFKRELVYAGVSQNTISVLYREFSDYSARPAFSQDLKYDLSQGDTIGYRGARFQVIKANNMGIRYKVIKPLD